MTQHEKRARLLALLRAIGEILDIPVSREEAVEAGKIQYLHLDYAPSHGGYRVVLVDVKGAGTSGTFGCTDEAERVKADDMKGTLQGILWGLQHGILIGMKKKAGV